MKKIAETEMKIPIKCPKWPKRFSRPKPEDKCPKPRREINISEQNNYFNTLAYELQTPSPKPTRKKSKTK